MLTVIKYVDANQSQLFFDLSVYEAYSKKTYFILLVLLMFNQNLRNSGWVYLKPNSNHDFVDANLKHFFGHTLDFLSINTQNILALIYR